VKTGSPVIEIRIRQFMADLTKGSESCKVEWYHVGRLPHLYEQDVRRNEGVFLFAGLIQCQTYNKNERSDIRNACWFESEKL
jgi:hypothetical protein